MRERERETRREGGEALLHAYVKGVAMPIHETTDTSPLLR